MRPAKQMLRMLCFGSFGSESVSNGLDLVEVLGSLVQW